MRCKDATCEWEGEEETRGRMTRKGVATSAKPKQEADGREVSDLGVFRQEGLEGE